MTTTGPNSPGTASEDTSIGAQSWGGSESSVLAADSFWAQFGWPYTSTVVSYYIKATNFGFSVSGTIDGVYVEVNRRRNTATGTVKDASVKLVKGGAIVGSDYADTATDWPTSFAYKGYGGASSLWGTTLTASDVNASDFGVVFAVTVTKTGGKSQMTPLVDHIRITVYSSAAAAGQPTSKRFGGVPFMGGQRQTFGHQRWIERASGLLTPNWRPAHG